MIRGIHHCAIVTSDITRLSKFYCEHLGFHVATKFGWPKGTKSADEITGLDDSASEVVVLRLGNTAIELFQFESPLAKSRTGLRGLNEPGISHVCLDVTDLEAEYKRLCDAGMVFNCPPQDLGAVRTTYGRDPDGNVLELQEVLLESSPLAFEYGSPTSDPSDRKGEAS